MNATIYEWLDPIRQELNLKELAMDASSCGITIADIRQPDQPLIYVNDAFITITGYSREEVLHRNCRFLQGMNRDQTGVDKIRRAIREGAHCTVLLRNYRKDGTLFWNELIMSPIYTAGVLTHFVGIQNDVTAREEARQQVIEKQQALETALTQLRETQAMLVHAEKMTALGQMVAGVAHEINNPIAYVSSNVYALKQMITDIIDAYSQLETAGQSSSDPDTQAAVAAVRQAIDIPFLLEDFDDLIKTSLTGLSRVRKIVDELRTFSRLDEAEYKVADLSEGIASTLLIAQVQLKDRVTVEVSLDNLPPIKCYPAELNQVFLNLLLNAAYAIDGKGKITITGEDIDDALQLTFTDTGCGMTPEVMENIFHPFYTTKPVGVGTGLGLSIAYKIITDGHGGQMKVASTPGVGSTFTISLPKEHKQ